MGRQARRGSALLACAITGGLAVIAGIFAPWVQVPVFVYGTSGFSGASWGRSWLVVPAALAVALLVAAQRRPRRGAWLRAAAAVCGLVVLGAVADLARSVAGLQSAPGTSIDLLRAGWGLYVSGQAPWR